MKDPVCQFESLPHIVHSKPLTKTEHEYCMLHPKRYGGKLYCYNHQRMVEAGVKQYREEVKKEEAIV